MCVGDFPRIAPLVSYMTAPVLEPFLAIDSFDETLQFYRQNSHRNLLGREEREAISHIVPD